MTLQLVPRSVRAIADQLNSYYRVLRGIDADSLLLRLSSGGAFEVRHSVTNTPVLRVTDAGATVSVADGSVTNTKLGPNAVTTDKILDGTIVDLDISALADIDAAKLRTGTVRAAQIGDGQLFSNHFYDNQIVPSRLYVPPGVAGVFRATSGPPGSFGLLQATDIGPGVVASANIVDGTIMNIDINAGAAIAYSKLALNNSIKSTDIADDAITNFDINPNAAIGLAKLAHVGAGNVLRSDGSANVGGQVVNADIAAAANINGAKMLDGSIPASKLIGGVPIANDSVTSAHIVDDTILNADINSAAAIALAKLAHVGAGNVLKSNGSANVGGQVVNADVAAGAAIAYSKLALGGALLNADVNAGAGIAYSKLNLNNQITSADIKDDAIVNADVNPTANIGLAKLAHVGAGNVLKSNGSANVGGQVVDADVAAGAGIDPLKLGAVALCSLSDTTNQSIPNNAVTGLTFNTEAADPLNMHAPGSAFITIPAGYGGVYVASFQAMWNSSAVGTRSYTIYCGGVAVAVTGHAGIAGFVVVGCLGLFRANAGDSIQAALTQDSGAALSVLGASQPSRFVLARVGA